jgi:hypothetical protein
MQMRIDDYRDVGARDSQLLEPVLQHRRAVCPFILDPVDVLEFRTLLVAGTGVDQHEPGWMLDQETAHSELDSIALVGGDAFLP